MNGNGERERRPEAMRNPFLVGERVYLRPVELEEAPLFQRWFNNPEVRQFLAIRHPLNRLVEEEWVRGQYRNHENVVLLVVAKEGNVPVGNVGLHRLEPVHRSAELGVALGEPGYWGRGFGREAVRLLMQWGFEELNLHRVYLRVFEYNRRAVRCYERVGFRHEGVLREGHFHGGKYHNVLLMGVLAEEFGRCEMPAPRLSMDHAHPGKVRNLPV